jgi:hypothetical protein
MAISIRALTLCLRLRELTYGLEVGDRIPAENVAGRLWDHICKRSPSLARSNPTVCLYPFEIYTTTIVLSAKQQIIFNQCRRYQESYGVNMPLNALGWLAKDILRKTDNIINSACYVPRLYPAMRSRYGMHFPPIPRADYEAAQNLMEFDYNRSIGL